MLARFIVRHEREIKASRKVYRERFDPLEQLSDSELNERYRIYREGISKLSDLLADYLNSPIHGAHALHPQIQVSLALRFFASGTFLNLAGDDVRVHKSTASRTVHRVARAICHKMGHCIRFPTGENELRKVKRGFHEIGGIPNVIGAVDCTHVRIVAPSVDVPAYINRKGYHSLNVQPIVDHNMQFTNCVARWPGGTHDSRIFQQSTVFRELSCGNISRYLLGDSGYPLRTYLLTPFLPPRSAPERR